MEIAELIKSRRQKLGLTQQELASALGYTTYQIISNVERGLAPIPKYKLMRLAQILKLNEKELLEATYKGKKIGHDADFRSLFERARGARSSTTTIVIDRDVDPELFQIIRRLKESPLKDKFIAMASELLGLEIEKKGDQPQGRRQ